MDEPDPARRARARAADYDGWLADAKAKWRTLRKKMAVLRNFVKTERDGGATAIAMVRDPLADPFGASDAARLTLVDATGAATAAAADVGVNVNIAGSGDTRRHEGLTRWKRVKPEDVKLGDGSRLQRVALVALARLAAANAPPHARNARATSLMVTAMGLPDAPRRDDEDDEDEDEDDAREATAAGEDDGDGDARDDAAGRLDFEDGEMNEEEMDKEEMDKEEMEDSEMEDSEMEDSDMETLRGGLGRAGG